MSASTIRLGVLLLLCAALCTASCPTLRRGSRGDCVKILQRVLGISADGIFGSGTEAAVKSYQRSKGLSADGIVGPATWSKIKAACGTVRRGSRGNCVKIVQRTVGASADGIFGLRTEAAVKRYQSANGLNANGVVDSKTWTVIYGGKASGGSSSGGGGSVPGTGLKANSCGCGIQSAKKCTGGPTQGAKTMASYLKGKFGGRTEIYNCRTVRGGSTTSLHGEGRAVDFYASAAQMQKVWTELKSVACKVGVQRLIYARQIWDNNRGVRYYGGVHPHYDHVHIELNWCAANGALKY